MPTYTRILTPLPDFIILTDEILTQYNASVFLEVKRNDAIINRRIVADDIARFVRSDRVHIPADTRSAFPVISVQSPVSIQCCWQS